MKMVFRNCVATVPYMVAICFFFNACVKSEDSVDPSPTLTFATASLSCQVGSTAVCSDIATSTIPAGGTISYSVENTSVATVSASTGVVTPVSAGTTTVTATQAALPGKNQQASTTYSLTILAAPDPVPTLTFATATSITCQIGGSACSNTATSSVSSGGAITYTINNTSVATVNATTGAITPVSAGTAVVTATQAAMTGKNQQATASYNLTITIATMTVTTFAGNGSPGFIDGTGTSAQFEAAFGVATDASGNVYVGDGGTVRKITPAGVVTTIAGDANASSGFVDGTGSAARFNGVYGVAVDAAGNIYAADQDNSAIRKITPAGVVTTLAGSGTAGFADGTGAAAQFNYPTGVAVDGSGNVYVADAINNRIRKITPTGVVTTLAGSGTVGYADGTGTAAKFALPAGIAVDGNGNLYVSDWAGLRIRKITSAGVVTTVAGSGTAGSSDGTGSAAQFNGPMGVAVDASGNIYVADEANYSIRKINPNGVVTTLAGSSQGYQDGPGNTAKFDNPLGVAVDGSGNIYVADNTNFRIRKIH